MRDWDWLTYLGIRVIVVYFAAIGIGLFISYLATKVLVFFIAPSRPQLASQYFGYIWMGSMLAIIGYSISECGYQLHFWRAPGIWGAPGKPSTIWGRLQYIFPPLGFVLGAVLNARLERRMRGKARSFRVGIAAFAFLLLLVTLLLSAWHAWQTLG